MATVIPIPAVGHTLDREEQIAALLDPAGELDKEFFKVRAAQSQWKTAVACAEAVFREGQRADLVHPRPSGEASAGEGSARCAPDARQEVGE